MGNRFLVCSGCVLTFIGLLPWIPACEPGDRGILWSVNWSSDGKNFAISKEWVGGNDAKSLTGMAIQGR
jgi:hypothetical protein